MIATPALLSPARGQTLLAIADGISNPAALAGGLGAVDARLENSDAASFSTLLAVSATSQQTSILAGNPVVASLAATGSTPPPIGKALPPLGIVNPFAFTQPMATAASPTPDRVALSDPAPADPAAVDVPAAALGQVAIPISLMLPPPPASTVGDPAPAEAHARPEPSASPRLPAKTASVARATPSDPSIAVAAMPALGEATPPTQLAKPIAGLFAPSIATDVGRMAIAAPLARPADNAALPPVVAAMRVALPMTAALAEANGLRPPALVQPNARDRIAFVAEATSPADRLDAPLTALFVPATASAHSDPLIPTASAPTSLANRIDFTALVDTIVRAREHAAPQTMAAPVSVSLAHADFGPVALRFRHEGDALAVTMASADPGFAPAVSAAAAADASAAAGQQQPPGNGQPQSSSSSSNSATQGSAQTGFAQTGSGQNGSGPKGQGQSDQRQLGQNRLIPRPASRAANRGGSDPDIFA